MLARTTERGKLEHLTLQAMLQAVICNQLGHASALVVHQDASQVRQGAAAQDVGCAFFSLPSHSTRDDQGRPGHRRVGEHARYAICRRPPWCRASTTGPPNLKSVLGTPCPQALARPGHVL